jgi:hypothetical protein
MADETPARRIEIDGDVLITDEEFCDVVLAGSTRRTSQRYDRLGLPFIYISGTKFRPLNAGRAWLADRIIRKTHQDQKRRRRGDGR